MAERSFHPFCCGSLTNTTLFLRLASNVKFKNFPEAMASTLKFSQVQSFVFQDKGPRQHASVLLLPLLHGLRFVLALRHHRHRVVHGLQVPHLRLRHRRQPGAEIKKNVAPFIICIQVFHLLFELVVLSKLRVEKSKVTKYQMKYFYDGYFSKDCHQTAEICCFVISSSEEAV